MIDEKVTEYERNSGMPFPPYEHLTDEECKRLRERLATKLGRVDASPVVALSKALREAQRQCGPLDAKRADFNLQLAFALCGIEPGPYVYINWAHFNNVDRMATSHVIQHFDDLWWPQADWIDIFDENVDWVMSIDYDGDVLALH
jgi:hypothetical protein